MPSFSIDRLLKPTYGTVTYSQEKGRFACNGIRDEALSLEGVHQALSQDQCQQRARERGDRGPCKGPAVVGRTAAEERGDSLEVIVCAIAVREEQNSHKDEC